jgi:acyl-ACP thioesterase
MYQTVKVKTWPLKPSKISFRREYIISDLEGNIIIKGSSEWLVVDKVRRRIMPSKGIYSLTENEHSEELVFKDKITKIHSFDPTDDGYELVPRFTDIDINGHVNNIKYANFVIDAMDGSENNLNYTYFQIDYHKEVLKDTALRIYLNKSDEEITALGKSNNELMFSCLLR